MKKITVFTIFALAAAAALVTACSSGTNTAAPANTNVAVTNANPANAAPPKTEDETPASVKAAFPDAQSFTKLHKDITKDQIAAIEGYSIPFSSPTFNEFVVHTTRPANEVLEKIRTENGIVGGLALSRYYSDRPNEFLVCVTETNTKEQIDALVRSLS